VQLGIGQTAQEVGESLPGDLEAHGRLRVEETPAASIAGRRSDRRGAP
jgi:hypothetical protein